MNENDFEQLRQHGAALETEQDDIADKLIVVQAERIKAHEATIDELRAALREARDSLLDIRDISEPYDTRENPPGYELSRIFTHAYIGLKHSEAVAKRHGMEKGDKS